MEANHAASTSGTVTVQPGDRRYLATIFALRFLGGIDCLALIAVAAPRPFIDALHRLCGLGELPQDEIVGYLVRSSSLLYALHGAVVLFLSLDVPRYLPLIRFMAAAAIIHGCGMFWIDWREGMPTWWLLSEGPGFAVTGLVVLFTLPRRSGS